jgi:taurine transport system substrate-binding protein
MFSKSLSMDLAACFLSGAAFAQTKELTFAPQDMLVPLRLVMESGELEKTTGYKINWRMFAGVHAAE